MRSQSVTPDDYLFYAQIASKRLREVFNDPNLVRIAICKKEFWDKKHYLQDSYIKKDVLARFPGFPIDLIYEDNRSMFASSLGLEETRRILLQFGLKEFKEFSDQMKRADPFVEDLEE